MKNKLIVAGILAGAFALGWFTGPIGLPSDEYIDAEIRQIEIDEQERLDEIEAAHNKEEFNYGISNTDHNR